MQAAAILAGSLLLAALPVRATVRLRRRGRPDLAPWSRLALSALAGATVAGALLGLDRYADSSLAAHMLQHLLVGDAAPLLLVLAVRGPLHAHVFPVRMVRAARRLRVDHVLAVATRPAPAAALWAASLGAWHVPAVYDAALADDRLHAFEHGCFLVAGLLVWSALVDPARRGCLPGWRRVGYAVALLAASGALGNVLVLSYRPLYPAYGSVGDQDLAGLVMMLEQLATLGTAAVLAARAQLRTQPAAAGVVRHPLAA